MNRIRAILLACACLARLGFAESFPENSPEHQALTAAGPFLADEAFALREGFWKGVLTSHTGRAVRLQFFKRNHYQLFLGVAPDTLPKGARLQLHIFDSENQEIASVTGDEGKAAVNLDFNNTHGSGLYLVLMRIAIPPGPLAETELPAALFYGWK